MKKNLLMVCGLAACFTAPVMAQSFQKAGLPRGAAPAVWSIDTPDFYMLPTEDGTMEDSIGFGAPGCVAYANKFTVAPGGEVITAINITWGLDSGPGVPHKFCIWTTTGPLTSMVLASTPVTVPGGAPSTTVSIDIPDVAFTAGQEVYIGFLADGTGAGFGGSFFGPWDNTAPHSGASYIWGTATVGAFNETNIGTAVSIGEIATFGLAGDWLIRADAESDEFLSLVLVGSVPASITPGTPQTFNVTIDPKTETLVGIPQLCYSTTGGAPFTCVNLTNTGGQNWQGSLPAFACGDKPAFYFTATGSVSGTKTLPAGAPTTTYTQFVQNATPTVLGSEGFNSGLPAGWTATGLWNIDGTCTTASDCNGGTYAYYGQTGLCTFNTGAANTGTLTSPNFSIPANGATLKFCYQYQGEGNTWDPADVLINGTSVFKLSGTNTVGWTAKSIDLGAYAGQSINVAFLFNAVDGVANDTLGLTIDGFEISYFECTDDACYPDCDGDTVLTIDDFICFQTFFALGDPYADCDGDSALTIDDFICFQTFFAIGC